MSPLPVTLNFVTVLLAGAATDAPTFERIVVDAQVGIGYGVAVADVDGDGRDDIVLVDQKEVRWYAAPKFERRVLCGKLTEHVRTMADVDGDGRDDIVAFGFHGVWTALSRGDGTFEPPRFVLARFGTQQGWRGGQE